MTEPILELKEVHSGYGSIKALKGVSLKVYPGEIVAIIGANGAGKSTTLMTICGIVKVEKGEVLYQGQVINKISPEKLPVMGLCQVPEGLFLMIRHLYLLFLINRKAGFKGT